MDARLGRQVPISKFEIDNFKRELDCTHGNIIDLHQLLEVQGKYSDNNTNKGITPSESAPARSVTNYQGRVLVSEGSQQRSIPGTPETPRSEQSSLCSCAVCCMYPSPLARVSPVMWALSPASNTSISTDSGRGNPLNDLVEFEGWGTSLAWWPDVLGKMPEDVIDHITKAFFSPDGLNLNIVRYTIGGTTSGNYTCGQFRAGGATESFRDGPNQPYNWTRDAGQRRILAIAKDLGADTFEAFSNSPPQWMTITGCSKGNSGGDRLHSNFDISQAASFVQYATDVLEHFKTDWGITFQTYAPFNEPYGILGDGFWTGEEKEQEGCNIDHATMTEVIKLLYLQFRERNITTLLSVADETQVDTAVISQEYFHNAGISPLINKVNGHGYWDSNEVRRDVLHRNSVRDGHRLWMDEVGWGESPLHDMSQGLNLATRILMDIKVMVSSAWVYWQVMEDVGAWGLLAVPYNNASVANIKYNNGYSAFLQFTRYIRKGFSIINTNDGNTLAAYDARSGTLVLVVVNPSKENEQRVFNLDLFFGSLSEITATRTSPREQHQNVSQEVALVNTTLTYLSPAESITTLVLKNVTIGSTQSNLVQDGDFETQPTKWLLGG
ncbi:unnamed protein product, partial [Allacma fusca]